MDRARAVADTLHLGEDMQASGGSSLVDREGHPAQWPEDIPTGPVTSAELLESGLLLKYPDAIWFLLEEKEVMTVTQYMYFQASG